VKLKRQNSASRFQCKF